MGYKDRLCIGYTKCYERCLLFYLDNGMYVNALTDEFYSPEELYCSSFVSYTSAVNDKFHLSLKKYIEEFKKSEVEPINIGDVFIGDLYVVNHMLGLDIKSSSSQDLNLLKLFRRNVLLLKQPSMYRNLFNNQMFEDKEKYQQDDYYIKKQSLRPFKLDMNISATTLPKNEVLEMHVKKYGVR